MEEPEDVLPDRPADDVAVYVGIAVGVMAFLIISGVFLLLVLRARKRRRTSPLKQVGLPGNAMYACKFIVASWPVSANVPGSGSMFF